MTIDLEIQDLEGRSIALPPVALIMRCNRPCVSIDEKVLLGIQAHKFLKHAGVVPEIRGELSQVAPPDRRIVFDHVPCLADRKTIRAISLRLRRQQFVDPMQSVADFFEPSGRLLFIAGSCVQHSAMCQENSYQGGTIMLIGESSQTARAYST